MEFCENCSNILYPYEDPVEKHLIFKCKEDGCRSRFPTNKNVVYTNKINGEEEEEIVSTEDYSKDPTLARTEKKCPRPECSGTECVFIQANLNTREKPFTIYFVCTTCNFRWKN